MSPSREEETGNSCRWSGSRGLSWKRFPSLVALASQACFAWRPQGLLLWSLLRSSSSYSSWQAAIWCLWQSQQRGNQTSGQWSTPHSNGYLAATTIFWRHFATEFFGIYSRSFRVFILCISLIFAIAFCRLFLIFFILVLCSFSVDLLFESVQYEVSCASAALAKQKERRPRIKKQDNSLKASKMASCSCDCTFYHLNFKSCG